MLVVQEDRETWVQRGHRDPLDKQELGDQMAPMELMGGMETQAILVPMVLR